MINLRNDRLVFSFPQVHRNATFGLSLQRTLRIPDDGKVHSLPPGLGRFPLRLVDQYLTRAPASWARHGGVMLPMYQGEALWLQFDVEQPSSRDGRSRAYPFAVKISTGMINAITGTDRESGLHPSPQDYLVLPKQPWLDGYCVGAGKVRQFVAMPLGKGYTVEEQVKGTPEFGGIQIEAYPLRWWVYWKRFVWPSLREKLIRGLVKVLGLAVIGYLACKFFWLVVYVSLGTLIVALGRFAFGRLTEGVEVRDRLESFAPDRAGSEMGIGAGGTIRQEIYSDDFAVSDWDVTARSRCCIHILNSAVWHIVTGAAPPTEPPTAKSYTDAGLPWFDYYADGETAIEGGKVLAGLKTVKEIGQEKGESPLPPDEEITPQRIVALRAGLAQDQVREGEP